MVEQWVAAPLVRYSVAATALLVPALFFLLRKKLNQEFLFECALSALFVLWVAVITANELGLFGFRQ